MSCFYEYPLISRYLKNLHKFEWDNFVKDTKSYLRNAGLLENEDDTADIPINCVGFNSHDIESMLRTRIWASLRSQTLFRTVSGCVYRLV